MIKVKEEVKAKMQVKALGNFNYFNNSGNFEIKKGQVIEIDNELAKDFIRQGLVEIVEDVIEEVKIEEVKIEEVKVKEVKMEPLKVKKSHGGD